MSPSLRLIAAFAALTLAVATGLGAWASHGLAGALPATALDSLETAVDYQFFNALGLLALVAIGARRPATLALLAAMTAIAVGLVLFCGGVYASSLDGPAALAGLAPIGGTVLILGWIAAGIALATTAAG